MADSERIVSGAKEFVEAHIKEDMDMRYLSDSLGYSYSYIRELFARECGIPMAKYVTVRRIANAAFDILYSDRSITDIAFDYGFGAYDSFTRAFRRVTGINPVEFRAARPHMSRGSLSRGLFGIEFGKERDLDMKNSMEVGEHGVILYDVPRVFYGAYGGSTPYPISLKACANYMGEDIDYADAISGCGAAFRFAWNTAYHDGSNVDVCHTYAESDPSMVYAQGVTALGRAFSIMTKAKDTSRESVKNIIVECLKKGVPVIAMGMVGPSEAGLITGFRDDGETMLGWSVFQNEKPFKDICTFEPCGYYATDKWWENGVDTLVVMGDKICASIDGKSIAKRAVNALCPRKDGNYMKGLAAYEPWIADLNDDNLFPDPDSKDTFLYDSAEKSAMEVLAWQIMCHDDAIEILRDGRANAARCLRHHLAEIPAFEEIAKDFDEVSLLANKMLDALGGWQRDEKRMRALAQRDIRDKLTKLAGKARIADTRAFEALKNICRT